MERAQKATQYGYANNAALVLTSERGRRDYSGAGEVSSLAGKKSATQMMKEMGDKATHKPIQSAAAAAAKKRPSAADEEEQSVKKKSRGLGAGFGAGSVLTADVENVYRPATRETRAVYETLLTFLQTEMGDKPSDVLASAADEVIAVLKDTAITVKDQQTSIEGLFAHSVDPERFRQLVNIGKKITDFKVNGGSGAGMEVDDGSGVPGENGEMGKEEMEKMGVAVVFGEDEEEEEGEDGQQTRMQDDEDEDEDEEGAEADPDAMDIDRPSEIKRGSNTSAKRSSELLDEDDLSEDHIDARTIDAHWIQRQVSTFQPDANLSQKAAMDIFTLLSNPANSDAACENALVTSILDFSHFAFIKKLLKNRWKIIYSMRLLQAGSDESARSTIIREMESDPKLQSILRNLMKTVHSSAEKTSDLEKTLLLEARKLEKERKEREAQQEEEKGEGRAMPASASGSGDKTTDAFWARRSKAVLDLESLAFAQGGHLMSSGEVKLPKNSEIINKTTHQEVHIPPLKPHPFGENESNVQISSLPAWAQPAFKGMKELNRVQSRLYETAMKSPENLLVCAPTGAGVSHTSTRADRAR